MNYKEHTWGDLTDRGRADVTSCHAPLRPHRFAQLYHTPLFNSALLCTAIHHSVSLYSVLLCFASLKHWREKPVSPSTQKTLSFSFILRMVGERSVAPTLAPWKSGEEICVTKSDTAGGVSPPRVPAEQRRQVQATQGGRAPQQLTHSRGSCQRSRGAPIIAIPNSHQLNRKLGRGKTTRKS